MQLFIRNKAKVASRVGFSERAVVYFRKLLFKSYKKKSLLEELLYVRRFTVVQKEICCRAFYK